MRRMLLWVPVTFTLTSCSPERSTRQVADAPAMHAASQPAPAATPSPAPVPVAPVAVAPASPPHVATPSPAAAPAAPAPAPKTNAKVIDKSGTLQAERRKFIQDQMADGYFKSAEQTSGDIVWLTVTPRFLALDFENKQLFVSVVYAFYFSTMGDGNQVVLRESINNKEVGKYAAIYAGLHMY